MLQLVGAWQLLALLPLPQQRQLCPKLRPLILHLLLHCRRIKAASRGCNKALCWLNC